MLAAAAALLSLVPAAAPQAAPIRTLLVGDSITFGVVSGPGGPSYAEWLASDLAGTHDVVNVARSGSSAFYWAPSTPCPGFCGDAETLFEERAAPELPADVATVLLGTNDALAFLLPEPTGIDAYEGLMREIVDGLFTGGVASVVLMTAPRPNVSAAALSLLAGYRERVAAICGDTAFVVCGPDLHDLLDPATDFAVGDIHPNAEGHRKIAVALEDTLLALPEPGTGALTALGVALLSIGPPPRGRSRAAPVESR
jgi:lysophospholipase L1-like esterase